MADDKNKNQDDDKNKNNDAGNGDDGNGKGNEPMIPKSRFDEVNREMQRLKKIVEDRKAKDEEEENERLAEQKKFKEIAEKEKAKREEIERNALRDRKVYALKAEAMKKGTVDADAVVAIANLDDIKVSEDGTVDTSSVTSMIENMAKEKAYLFGAKGDDGGDNNNTNIGDDGGAPNGGNNNKPTFKRSQLGDRDFYTKNRDAILEAQRDGRIVDDISPQQSK